MYKLEDLGVSNRLASCLFGLPLPFYEMRIMEMFIIRGFDDSGQANWECCGSLRNSGMVVLACVLLPDKLHLKITCFGDSSGVSKVKAKAAASPVLENMFDEAFRKSEKMIRIFGVKSINGIDAYRVFDESFARIRSLVTRESQQTLSPRIKRNVLTQNYRPFFTREVQPHKHPTYGHSEQLNVWNTTDISQTIRPLARCKKCTLIKDGQELFMTVFKNKELSVVWRVVSDGPDIQYVGSTSIELEGVLFMLNWNRLLLGWPVIRKQSVGYLR
nr:hypothetical protein [Tanacetum cinerariifolium]GEV32460.1 hypothetical protein [Tanacetum cinerariifolium]